MKGVVAVAHNSKFWKIIASILAVFILFDYFLPKITNIKERAKKIQIVAPVSAADIYPEFTCPCCGKPLDKENLCCDLMTGMIDFIDQQVAANKTRDEVMLATVKKFGLDRLTRAEEQEEIKALLAASAPADAAKIQITKDSYDFGQVSQKNGLVSTDFELVNEGKSDLVIKKLSSSCGCTSASIIYKNVQGPRFTMEGHGGKNPTDWQIAIKPGDKALLRVYYDPTFHPDLTGAVTRTISVFSNDPVEFEKKVRITLEQVP